MDHNQIKPLSCFAAKYCPHDLRGEVAKAVFCFSVNDDNSINKEEVSLLSNAANNGRAIFSPRNVAQQQVDLPFPMPGAIKVTPAGSSGDR